MCLVRVNGAMERFRAAHEDQEVIKCYKILVKRHNNRLASPYRGLTYGPGETVSDRVNNQMWLKDEVGGMIHFGIHVFLTKEEATAALSFMSREGGVIAHDEKVIVEFEFRLSDLVAVGYWFDHYQEPVAQAVVDCVFLSEAEYNRIVGEYKSCV